MSGFTNYLENQVLRWAFGKPTTYTAPSLFYVSLHTEPISDSTAFPNLTEPPRGYAYDRKRISWSDPTKPSGTSNQQEVRNSATVIFPTATGPWGTIRAIGIWDASVNGNMLFYANAVTPKFVDVGDTYTIWQGHLRFTLD